jgi:hypothetical protein
MEKAPCSFTFARKRFLRPNLMLYRSRRHLGTVREQR